MKWFKKIKIRTTEYDLVAGSRRSIKDPNNPEQQHFYGTDVWTDALRVYGDRIPKNFIVYGELVGFTSDGAPIQRGHTYECEAGDSELFVYRVAVITEDADLVDLSWDQVKGFCERHGFLTVPELDRLPKSAFDVEDFNEKDFYDEWVQNPEVFNERPVGLSAGGTNKDEGIAIRVETKTGPELYKFKNKSFYLFESVELDSGQADTESRG